MSEPRCDINAHVRGRLPFLRAGAVFIEGFDTGDLKEAKA